MEYQSYYVNIKEIMKKILAGIIIVGLLFPFHVSADDQAKCELVNLSKDYGYAHKLKYSDDGSSYMYIAKKKWGNAIVVNGEEKEMYVEIHEHGFVPNTNLYYVVWKVSSDFGVGFNSYINWLSNKDLKWVTWLTFTDDGKNYMYMSRKWLILNGILIQGNFSTSPLWFSKNNKDILTWWWRTFTVNGVNILKWDVSTVFDYYYDRVAWKYWYQIMKNSWKTTWELWDTSYYDNYSQHTTFSPDKTRLAIFVTKYEEDAWKKNSVYVDWKKIEWYDYIKEVVFPKKWNWYSYVAEVWSEDFIVHEWTIKKGLTWVSGLGYISKDKNLVYQVLKNGKKQVVSWNDKWEFYTYIKKLYITSKWEEVSYYVKDDGREFIVKWGVEWVKYNYIDVDKRSWDARRIWYAKNSTDFFYTWVRDWKKRVIKNTKEFDQFDSSNYWVISNDGSRFGFQAKEGKKYYIYEEVCEWKKEYKQTIKEFDQTEINKIIEEYWVWSIKKPKNLSYYKEYEWKAQLESIYNKETNTVTMKIFYDKKEFDIIPELTMSIKNNNFMKYMSSDLKYSHEKEELYAMFSFEPLQDINWKNIILNYSLRAQYEGEKSSSEFLSEEINVTIDYKKWEFEIQEVGNPILNEPNLILRAQMLQKKEWKKDIIKKQIKKVGKETDLKKEELIHSDEVWQKKTEVSWEKREDQSREKVIKVWEQLKAEKNWEKYMKMVDSIIAKVSDEKLEKLYKKITKIDLNNKAVRKYKNILMYLKFRIEYKNNQNQN